MVKDKQTPDSSLPLVVYFLGSVGVTAFIVLIVLAVKLGPGGLRNLIDEKGVIPSGHTFKNAELGYKLTLHGRLWREEEVGTHSDGSAIVEYTGLQQNANAMIFVHADIDDITDTTQWRIEQSFDDLINTVCHESRSLLPQSLYLVITIECEGQLDKYSAIDTYQFLQISKNRYIEFYGHYSASKNKYTENADTFKKTIHSLAPTELVINELQ